MTVHRRAREAQPGPAGASGAWRRRIDGRAGPLLELQRQAGNHVVVEVLHLTPEPTLQRGWFGDATAWVGDKARRAAGAVGETASWLGDRLGDALDIRENEALRDFQEDRQALREWRAQGVRGPQDLRAPTGIGGFRAAYDPALERLLIRLAGGAVFADSIAFVGANAVVNHPNPGSGLTQFVAAVNRLPASERRAAATPYLWTDAERGAFVATFNAGVEGRWSGVHEFHATEENWTDLGAAVEVDSALHAGAKGDDEHMSLTVYKTPPGGAGNVGVVQSGSGSGGGAGSSAGATDNAMVLNSPDVAPRADNLLESHGSFPPGSTGLDGTGSSELAAIGATFRGGGPACRVCGVTITASTGGPSLTFHVQAATEAAALRRFRSLREAPESGGNADIAFRSVFRYDGVGDAYGSWRAAAWRRRSLSTRPGTCSASVMSTPRARGRTSRARGAPPVTPRGTTSW